MCLLPHRCHANPLGGERMSKTLQQIMLLRSAVGNVLDNNLNVVHISLPEIWKWLDDIMVMAEEELK